MTVWVQGQNWNPNFLALPGLNSFTSRAPHFPALTEEFRDQLLRSGPAPHRPVRVRPPSPPGKPHFPECTANAPAALLVSARPRHFCRGERRFGLRSWRCSRPLQALVRTPIVGTPGEVSRQKGRGRHSAGLRRSFSVPGLGLTLYLFIHVYPRVLRGAAKPSGKGCPRSGFWAGVAEFW